MENAATLAMEDDDGCIDRGDDDNNCDTAALVAVDERVKCIIVGN